MASRFVKGQEYLVDFGSGTIEQTPGKYHKDGCGDVKGHFAIDNGGVNVKMNTSWHESRTNSWLPARIANVYQVYQKMNDTNAMFKLSEYGYVIISKTGPWEDVLIPYPV